MLLVSIKPAPKNKTNKKILQNIWILLQHSAFNHSHTPKNTTTNQSIKRLIIKIVSSHRNKQSLLYRIIIIKNSKPNTWLNKNIIGNENIFFFFIYTWRVSWEERTCHVRTDAKYPNFGWCACYRHLFSRKRGRKLNKLQKIASKPPKIWHFFFLLTRPDFILLKSYGTLLPFVSCNQALRPHPTCNRFKVDIHELFFVYYITK